MMRNKEQVIAEVERLTEIHNTLKSIDENYFSRLIKEAKKYELWSELVNLYCNKANIIFNLNRDFANAKITLSRCKRIFQKINLIEAKARYYSVLANLFRFEFNFPKAIQYINTSLEIISKVDTSSRVLWKLEYNNNYMLALIFKQLGEMPKYKYYLLRSEKIATKLADKVLYANCIVHKGTYYSRLRRYELAVNFLEQAIDLLRNEENIYPLGNALNSIGEVFYVQEKYHVSLSYFLDSYKLLSSSFPNYNYCYELVKIGDNYMKLGMLPNAKYYYLKAKERSQGIKNKDAIIFVLTGLCQYYTAIEEYKEVIKLRDQIDELRDEIQATERAKKVLEIEEKYHSALKQKEINYRKKKQRDSNKYLKLMEQKNEDLQQFSYALAHDLREPIRSTKNFVNVVAKKTKNPELEVYLNVVNGNLDRMYQLVDDILSLTRLDFEETPREELNMEELIKLIEYNLALQIEERAAKIILGPMPPLTANKNNMIQLFQNLISNGIKYNRNTPVIEVGYEQEVKGKGAYYIRDNGIGIPKDKLDHVFGLFKRAHGKEFQGTGVGLAICKKIVEKHQGDIWAESEEELGTCFYIRFP